MHWFSQNEAASQIRFLQGSQSRLHTLKRILQHYQYEHPCQSISV